MKINQSDIDKLYCFLKNNPKRVSKKEIATHFYLPYSSTTERWIRKLIAELATDVPIIAYSNLRGYTIPKKDEPYQVQHVKKTYNELKKRTLKMEKRMAVLENWIFSHQTMEL